jgi:hypothetical protein
LDYALDSPPPPPPNFTTAFHLVHTQTIHIAIILIIPNILSLFNNSSHKKETFFIKDFCRAYKYSIEREKKLSHVVDENDTCMMMEETFLTI